MTKRPTKADRMLVARHLRFEATLMRGHAKGHRDRALLDKRPDIAITLGKFATQAETRAARFERVADWMVRDGE